MRAYEFIGEAQNTEKPHWLGIPLRQLHDMKLKYKRDMAAQRQRQQLVGRMYKSNDDIEQELELADKALDMKERHLDILLKREELRDLQADRI